MSDVSLLGIEGLAIVSMGLGVAWLSQRLVVLREQFGDLRLEVRRLRLGADDQRGKRK